MRPITVTRTASLTQAAVLLAVTCLLPGCATRSTAPDTDTGSRIGVAVTAPLEDLNLVRTRIPPVLLKAVRDPYRQPHDFCCQALAGEVTALDAALGPDLDSTRRQPEPGMLEKGGTVVGDTAIDALRGTTESVIPFHGWVRRLTGAERHSREVARAVAAGILRRAYLKGIGETHGCESPAAPLPVPASEPAAATQASQSGQP